MNQLSLKIVFLIVLVGAAASTASSVDNFIEELGMSIELHAKGLRITHVATSSPAERARLKMGDVIRAIDGMITRNLTIDDAVFLLRGEPGEAVVLTVKRSCQTRRLRLVRTN